MREKPILFSAPMVRAILEGRKTQTRRIVKLPADVGEVRIDPGGTAVFGPGPYVKAYKREAGGDAPMYPRIRCPYGYPGDRLWVRETLKRGRLPNIITGEPTNAEIAIYAADDEWVLVQPGDFNAAWTWQRGALPSIHMPRAFSRITLEVTGVRVERLHEINEDDAKAEGVEPGSVESAAEKFGWLWTEINGAESWKANPWVWCVSFRRVEAKERAA